MAQGVIVVEFDAALLGTIGDLLRDDGYDVLAEVSTEEAGLDILRHQPHGVVVVISNTHVDHHLSAAFFAAVVADKTLRTRHRYILLSTNPRAIPPALAAHLTQLHADVLPKPFAIDALLASVADATKRLARAGRPGTY